MSTRMGECLHPRRKVEASKNCSDLSNHFRVGAVLELTRGKRSVGIRMDYDQPSFESATPAEVAAIPGEKQVQRLFPEGCAFCGGGFFDSLVDGNELRAF